MNLGGTEFNYISIFVYPLFLMFLPLYTPTWLALLISFGYGYLLDVFLNSLGMHMAASVFSAFVRPFLISFFEPQGGYKERSNATRRSMGFFWFLRFSAVFMFLHVFIFFSVEAFTPFYWRQIVFYTIPSYLISMVFILIYSFLFDPVE
jgi:hypothetical protein